MKIRTDFVTNSSSTSYCIVGVGVDGIKVPQQNEDGEPYLRDYLEEKGLDFGVIGDCDEYGTMGLSIHSMKGHETLDQFRQRVLDVLTKAFPDKKFKLKDITVNVDGGPDC